MEKQKLPNATLILVFGILSILTCCCYGIFGLIFGVIAIVMAKKATTLYLESPEQYSGYQNVKTGKILAYIGVVLSLILVILLIVGYAIHGTEGLREMQEEWIRNSGM